MDAILLRSRYEAFQGGQRNASPLETITAMFASCVAAWLSYECSISEGRSQFEACIWAVWAFAFGTIYIVYYALFRERWCAIPVVRK